MKNILFVFCLLPMCNVSFSQNEENTQLKKNETSIFKFYPNPAEDELYVLGTKKIKSIEFINVLGKRASITHYNNAIIKMDVSQLKSGIYLIRVINENDTIESKKLIIK